MTNLYLLQSKCSKKNDAHDVIVNLDLITSICYAEAEKNKFILKIISSDDSSSACFEKSEDLISVLREILSKTNGDISLVDKVKIPDIYDHKEEIRDKLERINHLLYMVANFRD